MADEARVTHSDRVTQRALGFDLARSFAIVAMVLINFQLMLAQRPVDGDSAASRALRWLVHVPSGRSSSLFVVLAGVGVSLMTAQARRATGDERLWVRAKLIRILTLRAAFLLVAGLLLWHVWWIDILHFYACYLLIAGLCLWWLPNAALLTIYLALIAGGAAFAVLGPDLPNLPFVSVQGFLLDALLDGVHPVLPWLAFVVFGLWLGRQDFDDPKVRWRLAIGAGFGFLFVELGSLMASVVILVTPALEPWTTHLDLLGTGWTPDPLYVLSASCTATLVIVLAHELLRVPRIAAHSITRAMISAGQLALSIYIAHAVVGVVIPRALFGWRESLPVEAVTAYWLVFCTGAIAAAAIWRRFFSRGPLELLMRALTSWELPRERLALERSIAAQQHAAQQHAAQQHVAPPRAPRRAIIVASLLALALLTLRVVGLPVGAATSSDGARLGQLSLWSQRQAHDLVIEAPTMVVLETHSGLDLYLELDQIDDTGAHRIAEDDDSGEGTEARIAQRLAPGRYRVTVRPYSATTGPYRLSILRSE